jgi:hypothetical protein
MTYLHLIRVLVLIEGAIIDSNCVGDFSGHKI